MRNRYYPLYLLLSFWFAIFACQPAKRKSEKSPSTKTYPSDFFFQQRAYPTGHINRDAYKTALAQVMAMRQASAGSRSGAAWMPEGPTNIGGRISAIAGAPQNPQIVYIGAASGGVWKTTNEGLNWTPVFDEAPTLSIGDIAVAPSQLTTLYVGTGEANAGGGSLAYDGHGVFRSDDEGANWKALGLEDAGSIGKIIVHPSDANKVFVAAMGYLFENNPDRGVFRTTNGGQNWEKVLFVNDSTGAVDLAFHPTDPNIVYAATWQRIRRPDRRQYGGPGCGIWRSTDGGSNWSKLSGGLPTTDIGRIGIAVSPAMPERLWAIFADETGPFKGIYRSENKGADWQMLPQTNPVSYSSFGWWFGKIIADPTDANQVFALGIDLHRSFEGGSEMVDIQDFSVHVDNHALYIDPDSPNRIILGNDGGVYISHDGAASWEFRSRIPVTQFYTCEIDYQNPERLYGGSQDNSTMRTLTGNDDDYEIINGGDGFAVLVNPQDPSYVLAESQYGGLVASSDGGFNFAYVGNQIQGRKNWNMPVVLDPTNPSTVYAASERVYKSTNYGFNWTPLSPDLTKGPTGGNLVYASIFSLGVSPKNNQILWAGTDDGNVQVSTNGGANWSNVTGSLPHRWVTKVVASPHDAQTAYVTFSGYRYNDYLPHVFKTNNLGAVWEDVSGDLPEVPVNDLIADPADPDRLWIATDLGVFETFDGGLHWELMGTGLPLVPVIDLTHHAGERKLLAATYGRSFFTITTDQPGSATSPGKPANRLEVLPNPLIVNGKIKLVLNHRQAIELTAFDLQGKKMATLYTGIADRGETIFPLERSAFPQPGTYLVRATGDGFGAAVKMVVMD
jgi:photosystem II stability/assembly factor-like uncharacterized protein